MPNYPTTRHAMLRAGYKLQSIRTCRRCTCGIEVWQTTNKKWITIDKATSDPDDHLQIVLHRGTCPFSDSFRLGQVQDLQANTRARVAIALYEEGGFQLAFTRGISATELRDELVSAAHKIQRQLEAQ